MVESRFMIEKQKSGKRMKPGREAVTHQILLFKIKIRKRDLSEAKIPTCSFVKRSISLSLLLAALYIPHYIPIYLHTLYIKIPKYTNTTSKTYTYLPPPLKWLLSFFVCLFLHTVGMIFKEKLMHPVGCWKRVGWRETMNEQSMSMRKWVEKDIRARYPFSPAFSPLQLKLSQLLSNIPP